MAPRITEKSRALIELPMLLFLRIADGDGKMTVQEMERFDQLLSKRDWCRSRLLERALVQTEAEKPALWKRYAAGDLKAGSDTVVAVLDTVLNGLQPDDLEPVQADLARLARELTKAADAGAGFFHSDADAKKAFVELSARIARPAAWQARAEATEPSALPTVEKQLNLAPHLAENLAEERAWRNGKLQLRCVQIVDETHDVRTFRFVSVPPKLFVYKPGQFMTLEVMVEGKVVRRSYTISTSPSRPLVISVTVKRVDGGTISNWLHDNLKVGDTLFADGPHGRFSCFEDERNRFLFISGGSGVTPVMSMSRWLADTSYTADIHFLHFARSPMDLIFEHELRLIERNYPTFRAEFIVSNAGPAADWTGRMGHISAELVSAMCPDFQTRSVYVCGPAPFMEATKRIFEGLGFDMGRFHLESFGGVPRDPKAAAADAGVAAKVTFATSNIEVNCKGSDYLLDLAIAANVPVAFSCRAGQCGTCKIVLLKGTVEQDNTDGLTPTDANEGFILSCQARPKGEVVVDL
jgi:ferredoxin-NADP reductase